MKFLYVGASWAVSSFPEGPGATNLAKEWGLPFIDCTKTGTDVIDRIKQVVRFKAGPVVWIYHEPLGSLEQATGLSYRELLKRSDWKHIREECNQFCLSNISKLGRPILLLGGPSDVVNCNYPNITVADVSWQKFLAKQAGLEVNNDTIYVRTNDGGDFKTQIVWSSDRIHRAIHENPDVEPCSEIVNAVWDNFFFWQELEKAGLFYETHPNRQGNEQYAKLTLPIVTKFLKDAQ